MQTFQKESRGVSGFTLIELMVTATVFGILLTYFVPSFKNTVEQARVNLASVNLQALWTAEALYHYENGSYAGSLATLSSAGLLDHGFVVDATNSDSKYNYAVDSADSTDFAAHANRINSGIWSGSLTIDTSRTIAGSVSNTDDGTVISAVSTE